MNEIYEPSEDSYLMSKTLKKEIPKLLTKNPEMKFLEVGCGSGINLQSALKAGIKKENISGTDINIEAVRYCKKIGFNCIVSDLFENVKGKFYVIAFNPPYLPLDRKEPIKSRKETTGGKKGNEIAIRFLKQAKRHLEKGGKIFLITSSLSEKIDFKSFGYLPKEIANDNFFSEKIFLWKLSIQ